MDGRACDGEAIARFDGAAYFGHFCAMVLDAVSLVQDDAFPFDLGQWTVLQKMDEILKI